MFSFSVHHVVHLVLFVKEMVIKVEVKKRGKEKVNKDIWQVYQFSQPIYNKINIEQYVVDFSLP